MNKSAYKRPKLKREPAKQQKVAKPDWSVLGTFLGGFFLVVACIIWKFMVVSEFENFPVKVGQATVSRINWPVSKGSFTPFNAPTLYVDFRGSEHLVEGVLGPEAYKVGESVRVEYREKPDGAILVQNANKLSSNVNIPDMSSK
ncbi:MAG: hypothetical protein ABJA67_07075 [Chthonomonadales bacterium]